MIEAKPFRASDIEAIDEVYKSQNSFGIPDLNNILTNTTLWDKTKIVGYGVVKIFCEAILLLDSRLNRRDRARSLKASMKVAIDDSKEAGLDILYVISNSKSFSQVLRNRYGFKAVPGELLMLNLEDDLGKLRRKKD